MANNAPAPIHPTDDLSILRVLNESRLRAERNVNDPNEWIYVGNQGPNANQPWAPDFQNGFFNVGPPRCLLRYRFLRPYDPDTIQNAVQVQGSVSGGSADSIIFTVLYPQWKPDGTPSPVTFTCDSNVYLTCCDDDGNLVIITIKTTGDVIFGFE
jgi:hypothetical protein